VREQQEDLEIIAVESRAIDNSLDSGEEPEDESNLNYEPSRDR